MVPIKASDEIVVSSSREEVWRLLADVRGYPRWWPSSLGVLVLSCGEDPVGAELEIRPATGQPFRCRVAAADAPSRLEMEYFGGLVEGSGEWRIEQTASGTRVTYCIDARAHGFLATLASRIMDLGAVHSRQMREVLQHLTQALQGRQPQT